MGSETSRHTVKSIPPPPPSQYQGMDVDAVLYHCGHAASTMKMNYYIDKDTLSIVTSDKDPTQFLLNFVINGDVAGRITIQLFEQLGKDMRSLRKAPEKEYFFQNEHVQIFETGIDIKSGLKETYHLLIKAEESPYTSDTISQVIVAVIETNMGDECLVIRSIGEILLVNEVEYVWHDIDGSGSRYDWNDPDDECLLCSLQSQDTTTVLPPPPLWLAVYNQIQHPNSMDMDSASAGQAPNGGSRSLCRHGAAITKKDVSIRRKTLKVEPNQEHPVKHLVEFTFDAAVAGSITVYALKDWVQSARIAKYLPPHITVLFQQGVGQIFKQEIDLSLYDFEYDTEQGYSLAFFESVPHAFESKEDIYGRRKMSFGPNFIEIIAAKVVKEKDEWQASITYSLLMSKMVCLWRDKKPDIPPSLRGKLHKRLITHKIKKIHVLDEELGRGSDGTVVYGGFYDQKWEVAVKRMVKKHREVMEKEIKILIKSESHPYYRNIVRWYDTETYKNFVYIALERCQCTLHDLITSLSKSDNEMHPTVEAFKDLKLWKNDQPSSLLLELLRDVVKGLAFLHEFEITHGDLKPQNVLIRQYKPRRAKVSGMDISAEDMGICAKVSDMCISKLLPDGADSGSSGWKAPERLSADSKTREAKTVDSFSLGCLLYFCITGGEHPFGKTHNRDGNIIDNNKDLSLVIKIPEADDLISRLLDPNPDSRLQVAGVVNHPLFWDPETRLDFLRAAGERVKDCEPDSNLLTSLESKGPNVFGDETWDGKLDKTLLNNIESRKQSKYKYDSVRHLLRVIRNKYNHYGESSEELRSALGAIPVGFEEYFSSRFPKLVMEVYTVLKNYCEKEELFHKYFKQGQF